MISSEVTLLRYAGSLQNLFARKINFSFLAGNRLSDVLQLLDVHLFSCLFVTEGLEPT